MMLLLYKIFLFLFPFGIKIVSPFNPKAKLWRDGRKNIFDRLEKTFAAHKAPLIWMHCASLGEFEQGRPVLEALRRKNPNHKILLTFFSPSGYEIRKNYAGADYIFYLPMDGKKNAEKFIGITRPQLAVFVKYEFWYYYLKTLQQQKIPLLLISGIFRDNQLFFRGGGKFYREMLDCFTHFFLQDAHSASLLQQIGYSNTTVCGDTRFDRVLEAAAAWQPVPFMDKFCGESKILVAGSIWPQDDTALKDFVRDNSAIRFVLAPHEIDAQRIHECLKTYPQSILYSQLEKTKTLPLSTHVLIIDNIGMLGRLYRYATVTYVGGGWGNKGLHNILEAAVYGKPVVFGPNHPKSPEADALVKAGGGFSPDKAVDIATILNQLFTEPEFCRAASQNAGNFVKKYRGATQIITDYIVQIEQN